MGQGAVVGVVASLALIAASPAAANTITVTTTQDEVNSSDHQCSLREAIVVADNPGTPTDCSSASQSVPNTIVLGPHTYALTRKYTSGPIDGTSGRLMMFTITTLTIQGAGSRSTTIDANGLSDQVVMIVSGASASLRNLTITGGHAVNGGPGATGSAGSATPTDGGSGGPGGAGDDGGGIHNDGTLTLDHVTVTGNVAGAGGPGGQGGQGGDNFNSHGGNGGLGGTGGRGGGVFNDYRLTMIDSTISGNHGGTGGTGGAGGLSSGVGYYAGNGGTGGTGGDGGGIASVGSSATLAMAGSTISGNFAGNGGDGGFAGGPPPSPPGSTYQAGF